MVQLKTLFPLVSMSSRNLRESVPDPSTPVPPTHPPFARYIFLPPSPALLSCYSALGFDFCPLGPSLRALSAAKSRGSRPPRTTLIDSLPNASRLGAFFLFLFTTLIWAAGPLYYQQHPDLPASHPCILFLIEPYSTAPTVVSSLPRSWRHPSPAAFSQILSTRTLIPLREFSMKSRNSFFHPLSALNGPFLPPPPTSFCCNGPPPLSSPR